MLIAAKCPSCGGSLSEASILALAPVCVHCGTVITKVGGTFGLTSAYGVNDPTITRKRIEADLGVLCDYKNKYVGMMEDCKQQSKWGVKQYAKLPNLPELLPLVEVPSLHLFFSLGGGIVLAILTMIVGRILAIPIMMVENLPNDKREYEQILPGGDSWAWVAFCAPLAFSLFRYCKANVANGTRPLENARRQKAYEEAFAAALKAAEPLKAAQDHRLRAQIRELEGLIETVGGKAEDVRGIMATL